MAAERAWTRWKSRSDVASMQRLSRLSYLLESLSRELFVFQRDFIALSRPLHFLASHRPCRLQSTSEMAQAAVPPLPSLAAFLERFSALVFSPFCPPSIFVHSPSDSPILLPALQQVLNSAIQPSDAPASDPPTVEQLLPKVAHLDLSEVHSVKAAFDRILSQLSGWELADGTAWEERDGGIKGWDGSMDGIKVVKRRKTKRKAGQALEGRTAKRARREDSEDLYAAPDEDAGEAEDPDDGDEAEWTLEWDADARAAADKPTLAPLRNTVDAFHHSLRTIYSASSSGDSFTTDLLADPTSVDNLPRRRFILVEHGELLSEVAGGSGTGGGVARETGVGLTFASTMHRLAELVSPVPPPESLKC